VPIYLFYWSDGEFIAEIDADPDKVKELLDEYRESDPDGYNNLEFMEFLEERGIKARIIEPDHEIYF